MKKQDKLPSSPRAELGRILDGMSRTGLLDARREVTKRIHAHDGSEGQNIWSTVRNCLLARGVSCPEHPNGAMRQFVSNAAAGLEEFETKLNEVYEDEGRAPFKPTRTERSMLIQLVADEYIRGRVSGEEDPDDYSNPNAGQILQQFNQWHRIAGLINRMFPGYGLSILPSLVKGKRGAELLEGMQS